MNWTVQVTDNELVGRIPVIAKKLVGKVDNSAYPLIDVNINTVSYTHLDVYKRQPLHDGNQR